MHTGEIVAVKRIRVEDVSHDQEIMVSELNNFSYLKVDTKSSSARGGSFEKHK